MITVWGGQTSRSIRAVWVLEEMGLPYRVRQVDIRRTQQGLQVVHGNDVLAVSPTTQRIVDELDDLYNRRSSKVHGQFSPDEVNYPAAGHFSEYLAEDARIDYTQKIHKTIVDIQNQLLGIPVATIVVASQLKAPTDCGPELWTNFAVLAGAWIFVVLLLIAIANQWLTLDVIGDEIDRQQTRLREEFAAVSDDFADTFAKLKGRITWHRWVLGVVALIGIAGGIVATCYKNSVSALPLQPCAGAPTPDAEASNGIGSSGTGNETAPPAADLVADGNTMAAPEPPTAADNGAQSVVGNALNAGGQAPE
jgi:hypothetical protein